VCYKCLRTQEPTLFAVRKEKEDIVLRRISKKRSSNAQGGHYASAVVGCPWCAGRTVCMSNHQYLGWTRIPALHPHQEIFKVKSPRPALDSHGMTVDGQPRLGKKANQPVPPGGRPGGTGNTGLARTHECL
jgi:hypothetical protein